MNNQHFLVQHIHTLMTISNHQHHHQDIHCSPWRLLSQASTTNYNKNNTQPHTHTHTHTLYLPNESVSKIESARDDDVHVHYSCLPSISTRTEHFTKINGRALLQISDCSNLRITDTHITPIRRRSIKWPASVGVAQDRSIYVKLLSVQEMFKTEVNCGLKVNSWRWSSYM